MHVIAYLAQTAVMPSGRIWASTVNRMPDSECRVDDSKICADKSGDEKN